MKKILTTATVFAFVLICVVPASTHAQTVSFSSATNFTSSDRPISVEIGDLNGDGKLDLAMANYESGAVSILLGDGTGSFGAATYFAVGVQPISVAIGDLNGDGKPDLVAGNVTSQDVSILLGDGAGSFGPATNIGSGAYTVTIKDLNGDNKPDLVVTNTYYDVVSIFMGDGTGSFGSPTDYAVGSNPNSAAIGDYNSDGKLDLAVLNYASTNVSILLGDGTGSFGAATNFAVEGNAYSIATADFNGDGKPDLAVANITGNNVSIFLGNGTGSFGPATDFAAGVQPIYLAIGDLNGDGKLDLAVADSNSDSGNVSILLGDGTGSFGALISLTAGSLPRGVAIGDLNGDGKPDLAVPNQYSDNVSIFLNTTVGNHTPAIAPIGNQSVNEGQSLQFTVSASDPDGNALTYSATNLPAGATFNPTTHTFTWTPSLTQAGVYVVTFGVTDNGVPSLSSSADVTITVNDSPTPVEQAQNLVNVVTGYSFPKNIENSYIANLKKVGTFIERGQITPAINQLNAFIKKVERDYAKGTITLAQKDTLVNLADALLADIH